MDVFQYFTAACYKGFGDDDNGFYATYAKVFDQLATEDIEFMDSPDEFEDIPKFGTSTSDYVTVVGPFYAYWQSYCTKKTYTWLCPHNITEIRDRRILREIEKETKKLAQKARKERNDEIRALVSFVRKRDKRVQEYKKKLEERAEINRIKQQQHRLAQLRKNQQEAAAIQSNHQSVFNTTDHEARLREIEQAYGTSDSEYDDYDENDDIENEDNQKDGAEELTLDDLYCVACNKSFKNISSFENHESSKKHRESIEKLKKQMMHEEQEHLAESDDEDSDLDLADLDEEVEEEQSDNEIKIVDTKKKSNKKSKKSKNKAQIMQPQSDEENADLEQVTKPMMDVNIGNVSDNDAWNDDAGKKSKKSKNRKANIKSKVKNNGPEPDTNGAESSEPSFNKKLNRKSAREVTSDKSMANGDDSQSIDVSHTCVTCQSTFDSKNKLFNHLKKTNHGVYIPKTASTSNQSKRGKRK